MIKNGHEKHKAARKVNSQLFLWLLVFLVAIFPGVLSRAVTDQEWPRKTRKAAQKGNSQSFCGFSCFLWPSLLRFIGHKRASLSIAPFKSSHENHEKLHKKTVVNLLCGLNVFLVAISKYALGVSNAKLLSMASRAEPRKSTKSGTKSRTRQTFFVASRVSCGHLSLVLSRAATDQEWPRKTQSGTKSKLAIFLWLLVFLVAIFPSFCRAPPMIKSCHEKHKAVRRST